MLFFIVIKYTWRKISRFGPEPLRTVCSLYHWPTSAFLILALLDNPLPLAHPCPLASLNLL